ncbi:hypothetical protein, partial [Geitlerinema sp. PCC 9228]|uniref:hypothetical protein n=1 Tax=Geitlerinema sp. PCC 9228 TaxID=111611 RepID=UPI001B8BFA6F
MRSHSLKLYFPNAIAILQILQTKCDRSLPKSDWELLGRGQPRGVAPTEFVVLMWLDYGKNLFW